MVYVGLLALVWSALFSSLDLRVLGFGALLALGILSFCARLQSIGPQKVEIWFRPLGFLYLGFAFIRELIYSAVSVAREAWRPQLAIRPGIIAMPLQVESDLEVTVLASLISLTPGTLSLDVSPDRKTLYIHALVVEAQGERIRENIHRRLEKPVMRAFRIIAR